MFHVTVQSYMGETQVRVIPMAEGIQFKVRVDDQHWISVVTEAAYAELGIPVESDEFTTWEAIGVNSEELITALGKGAYKKM